MRRAKALVAAWSVAAALAASAFALLGAEVAKASYWGNPGGAFGAQRFSLGSTFNKRGGGTVIEEVNHGGRGELANWEPVKTWTEDEWNGWTREAQAINDCTYIPSACRTALTSGVTQVDAAAVTSGEVDNAVAVVTDARAAGTSLDSGILSRFLAAGEEGGLIAGAGTLGTALGLVSLGPVAFKAGEIIGEGIDELFGFPTGEEKEEELKEGASSIGCTVATEGAFEIDEWGKKSTEPEGKYIVCGGSPKLAHHQRTPPEPSYPNQKVCDPSFYSNPAAESLSEAQNDWVEDTTCPAPGATQESLIIPVHAKCLTDTQRLILEQALPVAACIPEGLPAPGLITPEIEENTYIHAPEATTKPVEQPGFDKATLPMVNEAPTPEVAGKLLGNSKTQKYVEEHSPKSFAQVGEEEQHKREEEEQLVIPEPNSHEKGADYKKRLEEAGFTSVETVPIPEAYIDPELGPNEVTSVSPAPGSKVLPEHHITVDENPSNAPTPGGGGLPGGPTLPGIHFPNLAVACHSFPFGVPCWIVSEFEAWSSTPTHAPELGFEEMEIHKVKIPGAKVSLAPLEPIMNYIRPWIIVFSTIGAVVLFYRWATGKGVGTTGESGAAPDRQEPSDGYEGMMGQ